MVYVCILLVTLTSAYSIGVLSATYNQCDLLHLQSCLDGYYEGGYLAEFLHPSPPNHPFLPQTDVTLLDKPSAAELSLASLYWISKSYPINLVAHLNCSSLFKRCFMRNFRLRWSMQIMKRLPIKYCLHFFLLLIPLPSIPSHKQTFVLFLTKQHSKRPTVNLTLKHLSPPWTALKCLELLKLAVWWGHSYEYVFNVVHFTIFEHLYVYVINYLYRFFPLLAIAFLGSAAVFRYPGLTA